MEEKGGEGKVFTQEDIDKIKAEQAAVDLKFHQEVVAPNVQHTGKVKRARKAQRKKENK